MSRYHSYLASASAIIKTYQGAEPFVHFGRKFFAGNKKFGSRDRKIIAAICYSYFRAFHLFRDEPLEQRILNSVFLCETAANAFLLELDPVLHEKIELPVREKIKFLEKDIEAIFPGISELSDSLNKEEFAYSFLSQPLLYLRLRPGREKAVFKKLNDAQLPFDQPANDCIALQNATSLDTILKINREVVVQDFNSQRVFNFLTDECSLPGREGKIKAWDCCAASGGKSILLYDRTGGKVELTVSDIRKNILHNLQERLHAAGVAVYKTLVADLVKEKPGDIDDLFDLVICDVPCTGSGTWSRTPEQLAFFKTYKIADYAKKQITIADNAQELVKEGGLFFYITCSVFQKENEEIVAALQKTHVLQLLHQQYFEGYDMQADTLFVAVFRK